MSKSILTKHYTLLLKKWPTDLLRPAELTFQRTLQNRINALQKPLPPSPSPSPSLAENVVSNGALVSIPAAKKAKIGEAGFDEKSELDQVNVLYSFLEDRYMKQYPLSPKMLKPASNPDYYEKLIKELEEAPRRSWLQRKLNQWKGMLRFR